MSNIQSTINQGINGLAFLYSQSQDYRDRQHDARIDREIKKNDKVINQVKEIAGNPPIPTDTEKVNIEGEGVRFEQHLAESVKELQSKNDKLLANKSHPDIRAVKMIQDSYQQGFQELQDSFDRAEKNFHEVKEVKKQAQLQAQLRAKFREESRQASEERKKAFQQIVREGNKYM